MRITAFLFGLSLCGVPLLAQTRVIATVTNAKSGAPVTDLKTADFRAVDGKESRTIENVEFVKEPVDIMLLLDTSLVGEAVQPVASAVISQLEQKEQMAIVAFANSADLIQDFTSSKQLLARAMTQIKYGNEPRVFDALYAAVKGGFDHSTYRRVIILLTTGYEGSSRTDKQDVLQLARRNGVSIYPVYLANAERSSFEQLARQSGGAYFHLNPRERGGITQRVESIMNAIRSHYVLTLSGNRLPGEKFKITVERPEKLFVSGMAIE